MHGKSFYPVSMVLLMVVLGGSATAGILYPGSSSWWTYMYQGDKASPGAGFTALDGKWSHDNGSDEWDESEIGKGAPGGAIALKEGDTTFLRMQDCGDPRPNPADPSNRKIMFGHSVTGDLKSGVADTILDAGVTITFRARIPTSGPLDDLNTAGAKTPYPAGGDGYVPHDGGKDNFNVRQSSGDKIISFALAVASDDDELSGKSGLTMNKLNGTSTTGDVDLQGDEPGTVNILELDPTQWHEFWITIQADTSGTGTHVVHIYLDGSLEPEVFYVTAGDGDDYSDSYIAMGVGATPQSGAIDIDFFAYHPGVVRPDEVYTAGTPSPADGELSVTVPLFTWTPGATGVFHNVYLGTSPELTEADLVMPRAVMTLFYYVPGVTPGTTYYWRVDEVEADGVTVHTGNVWSFVAQALTAYYPTPADGANDASPAPTLSWLPGQAALAHHLYFSDDADAVAQGAAAADKGEPQETTFAPGDLETASVYYWRVDEAAPGGEIRTGPVWRFATCLPVDDFEGYNDEEGKGTRIYETWLDGATNQTGSLVGYWDPPFAEQTVVHAGLQSMPLDYNNVNAPFYSEAEREFAASQDWTIKGVDTLVLYVQGKRTNSEVPLYVALEDASRHIAAVAHTDPAVVTRAKWTEWRIPLSDFADVNPARIKKIYIGLGDRNDSQPGGAGLIFVDDILLTRPVEP
jgi:hypothetical protein